MVLLSRANYHPALNKVWAGYKKEKGMKDGHLWWKTRYGRRGHYDNYLHPHPFKINNCFQVDEKLFTDFYTDIQSNLLTTFPDLYEDCEAIEIDGKNYILWHYKDKKRLKRWGFQDGKPKTIVFDTVLEDSQQKDGYNFLRKFTLRPKSLGVLLEDGTIQLRYYNLNTGIWGLEKCADSRNFLAD
eukprot:SAG11_NODE_1852_length_4166_cov_156.696090_3_plen_185_part_00